MLGNVGNSHAVHKHQCPNPSTFSITKTQAKFQTQKAVIVFRDNQQSLTALPFGKILCVQLHLHPLFCYKIWCFPKQFYQVIFLKIQFHHRISRLKWPWSDRRGWRADQKVQYTIKISTLAPKQLKIISKGTEAAINSSYFCPSSGRATKGNLGELVLNTCSCQSSASSGMSLLLHRSS